MTLALSLASHFLGNRAGLTRENFPKVQPGMSARAIVSWDIEKPLLLLTQQYSHQGVVIPTRLLALAGDPDLLPARRPLEQHYKGYSHADGYTGYNSLYAGGATHIGCWMHVRRYFFEAKESDPARAHEALARIRLLHAVESAAKDKNLTGAELAAYRQEHAGPLLEAFAVWLAQEVPRALPKSKVGEALVYASNQWPSLVRYLADGRLSIDNSPVEQALRPFAAGRRNWLQIAGDGGLTSAAVLLSMAATTKHHGINP